MYAKLNRAVPACLSASFLLLFNFESSLLYQQNWLQWQHLYACTHLLHDTHAALADAEINSSQLCFARALELPKSVPLSVFSQVLNTAVNFRNCHINME